MSEAFSDSSSAGSGNDIVMSNSPVSRSAEVITIHNHPQGHENLAAGRSNGMRSFQEHDPQFYPEQAAQIPYEEMANSCKEVLEGNTNAPPHDPEDNVDYSDWLRDDIEYAEPPPKQRYPDPGNLHNATGRVLIRYDDEDINESIEGNLRCDGHHEGSARGDHLSTPSPHFNQYVAERSSVLDREQFQISNGPGTNQRVLLPALWSSLPDSQSSSHTNRGVSFHETEARSLHHEEPPQSAVFHGESVPQLQRRMKPINSWAPPNTCQLHDVPSEGLDLNFNAKPPVKNGEMAKLNTFINLTEFFEPRVVRQPPNLDYYLLGENIPAEDAELEELAVFDKEANPKLQHLLQPFKPRALRNARKHDAAPQEVSKSPKTDKPAVRRSARIHSAQYQKPGNSVDTDKSHIPRSTRKRNVPTKNAPNSPAGAPYFGSLLWKALYDPPEGSSQRKADYLSSLSICPPPKSFSPQWPPTFRGFEEQFYQSPYPQLVPLGSSIEPLPAHCAVVRKEFQTGKFDYIQNSSSGHEPELIPFDLSIMDPADRELYDRLGKDFDFDGKIINQPVGTMPEEPLFDETNHSLLVENENFNLKDFLNTDSNHSQEITFKHPTLFGDDYNGSDSQEMPSQEVAGSNIICNYYPETKYSTIVDQQATMSGTAVETTDAQICINRPHSDLSNQVFRATGQEYLKLRYLVLQPLSGQRYQRLQEVARRLGPEVVAWLEYNAEKRGSVKGREATKKQYIKTRQDGYMPPLGYDPLDDNLTGEQENQEAGRCHNVAIEVFGLDASGGGNEDTIRQVYTPNFSEDLGLPSEKLNALLDDVYLVDQLAQQSGVVINEIVMGDIQIDADALVNNYSDMGADSDNTFNKYPVNCPMLSATDSPEPKSKPISMSPNPLQILTVATPEQSGPALDDSPTSTASFRTAVIDIQDSRDDRAPLVLTRPNFTVLNPPAREHFKTSGSRIDNARDLDEGEKEDLIIPIALKNKEASMNPRTPKGEVTLPTAKSTRVGFDRVEARKPQNRDSPDPVSRTSAVPQSAAWSWGEVAGGDNSQSYRLTIPKTLTEAPLLGLRSSAIVKIARKDQSSSKEGIIHYQEPRSSGSRHRPHQRKPSQFNPPPQEQSRGYLDNLAVGIQTQTLQTSFTIQAKSDRGGFSISDKANSGLATKIKRAASPSRDQDLQQTIRILKSPQTSNKSCSRIPQALMRSRMQSYGAPHFAVNSTMSTQTTKTIEGFMASQQHSPIQEENSPKPTDYERAIPGGSPSGPSARPVNLSSKPSFTPKSAFREVAYGSFGTPVERTNAITRFNNAVRKSPDIYRKLMIVTDPNPDPAVLEISGPLGSNVRGAMREIFPGWRIFAKVG